MSSGRVRLGLRLGVRVRVMVRARVRVIELGAYHKDSPHECAPC